MVCLMRVFFFQAEDGIRDIGVTGVQTCALPIFPSRVGIQLGWRGNIAANLASRTTARSQYRCRWPIIMPACRWRSEERRVGKECRFRWAREHDNKKGVEEWVQEGLGRQYGERVW